jgi:transposase
MADSAGITARYEALKPVLDERARRLLAAKGRVEGALRDVMVRNGDGHAASSVAEIRQGLAELKNPDSLPPGRIRRKGGGRKKAVDKDNSLTSDLQNLLESTTRGDPESPLRWTCKSVRQLTGELTRMKHRVSHQVVADLLHALGYSLQANSKTKEGTDHPDRNAQFEHLNGKVKWCLGRRQP